MPDGAGRRDVSADGDVHGGRDPDERRPRNRHGLARTRRRRPSTRTAPITSVSELTPISSFGGDIVTIAAGPGGVFGNDVYAISRGAGDNADAGAINRPGVIYRVDPATGKASVFFDLNTVLSQTDPATPPRATPAANGAADLDGRWSTGTASPSIPKGIFSGTPAMFVSSVDRSDPNKNIIFEIAPNGTLMGVFVADDRSGCRR